MASVQPSEIPAYQQPFSQVLTALGADARRGLTDGEARVRLGRHGKNELTADTPVPSWRKFLAQFQDVLVVLLLVATAISAALWLYERDSALPYEALTISVVVLLNALMATSRSREPSPRWLHYARWLRRTLTSCATVSGEASMPPRSCLATSS